MEVNWNNLQMKYLVKPICISFIFVASISISCNKNNGVLPTVETSPITDVTIYSAICGGTVTSEGSGPVTARGICWAAKLNPTTDDLKSMDGSGPGSFESTVSGVVGGIAYFVRAYATNSAGTGYGVMKSFIPSGQTPTASVGAATNITSTSATLNGYVNPNSFSTTVIFEYGLSTAYTSTITASQSPVFESSNVPVSANLTGLNKGTLYHYRVKATSFLGAVFSNDMTFTTLSSKAGI
jgi:starch-binding outer membrane protein SusE/F